MASPEKEVEITALISFNAMDPLNALNDLAANAEGAQFAEDWDVNRRIADSSPVRRQQTYRTSLPESKAQANGHFLFRLSEPLGTATEVQKLAGLPEPPKVRGDVGSEVSFCEISGATKSRLEIIIQEHYPDFDSFFIQYTLPAAKHLDAYSPYPTLGLESTLPHHRASLKTFLPQQDEYPVWYFFYGTLGERTKLSQLLRVPDWELGMLLPAYVYGGRLGTWGKKYKALLDGYDSNLVEGNAYQVMNEPQERALREYETENYEVVRCAIFIGERSVSGCTFRFVGTLD